MALMVLGITFIILIIAAGMYVYRNLNYDKNVNSIIRKAGFVDMRATLPDGTILNYGECLRAGRDDNKTPLLLIHGHQSDWKDYYKVISALTRKYRVYAVDCHGHGKSSKDVGKYTAKSMGEDFIWFIENVIKQPVVVSGHSMGGLIAAWLADNSPENVIGLVIEDAPFFSTQVHRIKGTFAWIDGFEVIHKFLNQGEERNYTNYYLENCYVQKYFKKRWAGIKKCARNYMNRHPDRLVRIYYLPPSINRAFGLTSGPYDLHFGDKFYDGSWFEDFDQESTLEGIACPAILIHTSWCYSKEGILLGAMDEKDAKKVSELMGLEYHLDVNSGHDFHYDKPKDFVKILLKFNDSIVKTNDVRTKLFKI
ncbi:MAG: alpha/beta hydrolase [Clostridioides sp.]|jgi:pimeloyl-ACP methyl ester carboxylesterase|nr:alpha/beta hydrolase [Clostridioides sp.]